MAARRGTTYLYWNCRRRPSLQFRPGDRERHQHNTVCVGALLPKLPCCRQFLLENLSSPDVSEASGGNP